MAHWTNPYTPLVMARLFVVLRQMANGKEVALGGRTRATESRMQTFASRAISMKAEVAGKRFQ
jgi:hypothetical protein